MDFNALYAPYQKKYGLPSYTELNIEFELMYVGPITQIDFPLRFIRRRMSDRLAIICSLLQSLLQPNPSSFINLNESSFYSKEEKENIQELLRQLMHFERQAVLLDTQLDEKEDAQFIKDTLARWIQLKPELLTHLRKLPQGWLEKVEKKQEFVNDHYFG